MGRSDSTTAKYPFRGCGVSSSAKTIFAMAALPHKPGRRPFSLPGGTPNVSRRLTKLGPPKKAIRTMRKIAAETTMMPYQDIADNTMGERSIAKTRWCCSSENKTQRFFGVHVPFPRLAMRAQQNNTLATLSHSMSHTLDPLALSPHRNSTVSNKTIPLHAPRYRS